MMEFILIKESLISSGNFGFYVFFSLLAQSMKAALTFAACLIISVTCTVCGKIQLHFFEEYFKLIPMSRIFTEHVAIK